MMGPFEGSNDGCIDGARDFVSEGTAVGNSLPVTVGDVDGEEELGSMLGLELGETLISCSKHIKLEETLSCNAKIFLCCKR